MREKEGAMLEEAMDQESLVRLSRDLKKAAADLTVEQARFLVDIYYAIQNYRIRAGGQERAMTESGEPHQVIQWVFDNSRWMESDIKRALDKYSEAQVPGRWLKSICGIGPVLAAGFLAHLDITHCPTAGHLWSFAGLNPTVKWEKSQKRPWNARLKVLCWKAGESFVKVSGNDKDVYGKVWLARKEQEQHRNEEGLFAEQAAAVLANKKIGKDTEAYKHYSQGKLPPGHIHARAKRYAVKLFLAHLQHVAYEHHYGTPPPKPYVIEHLGHVNFIAPPNWPMQ